MIETLIIKHLHDGTGHNVYAEMPDAKVKPKQYIVIDKTGSSEENFIKQATIAVQSYAESKAEAAKLNELVKETMLQISDNEIASVTLNSDYSFPDTSRKYYRYQAVFDIYHY